MNITRKTQNYRKVAVGVADETVQQLNLPCFKIALFKKKRFLIYGVSFE